MGSPASCGCPVDWHLFCRAVDLRSFFPHMKAAFHPEKITADFVAFRRATFFGAILGTTGLGAWLLWKTFLPEGISALEWAQLFLFVLLFQQIASGFWLAAFGFLTTVAGGDTAQISLSLEEEDFAGPP